MAVVKHNVRNCPISDCSRCGDHWAEISAARAGSKGMSAAPQHDVWHCSIPDCAACDELLLDIDTKSAETDPTGREPSAPGAKLDAGKLPILRGVIQYFPRAIEAVAEVSAVGARKYTWRGWVEVPDGVSRYGDAMVRHLIAEAADGPWDKDTSLLHAAQVAWNALARLELMLQQGAVD